MRTLTIDIGTNSTLYLIADLEGDNLRVVERGIAGNRLGAGKNEDGWLPPDLIEENRQILVKMIERGRALGCDAVKAVGTEALRSAANSLEFLAMAASIGLGCETVDGEREASLAWRGVVGNQKSTDMIAILDIGGGSSELIVGKSSVIEYANSVPIGAVTATRRFTSDPPPPAEIVELRKEAEKLLAGWLKILPMTCPLIGIAGTCTSLASLGLRISEYKPGVLEGYRLSHRSVIVWKNKLLKMSLDERRVLPGMPPARAAILPAGAVILEAAMRTIGKKGLRVSEKGLIFGLAWELAGGLKALSP